jgi:hypothetical protein
MTTFEFYLQNILFAAIIDYVWNASFIPHLYRQTLMHFVLYTVLQTQVISTARTCNCILIVLDAIKPITHKRLIEKELEGFGIR